MLCLHTAQRLVHYTSSGAVVKYMTPSGEVLGSEREVLARANTVLARGTRPSYEQCFVLKQATMELRGLEACFADADDDQVDANFTAAVRVGAWVMRMGKADTQRACSYRRFHLVSLPAMDHAFPLHPHLQVLVNDRVGLDGPALAVQEGRVKVRRLAFQERDFTSGVGEGGRTARVRLVDAEHGEELGGFYVRQVKRRLCIASTS